MNTFTPAQYIELAETLNQLNNDPSCNVCVITAYGKLFTAGTDIINILTPIRGTKTTPPIKFQNEQVEYEYWCSMLKSQAGECIKAMINFEKILIYAPQGGCVGIGTTMSQLADYVICSESSWFTTPFMGLNFCAEGCSSYTFPRILGPHLAKEMLLGEKKLTSSEALKTGFVNYVYPDSTFKRDTLLFASKIALYDQDTLKITKSLIVRHDKDILLKTNEIELEQLAKCFTSPKAKKSLLNFVQKQELQKKKLLEEKRLKSVQNDKLLNPNSANTTDRTERIDRMISSIGGWDQPPPTPGSVSDISTKLHQQQGNKTKGSISSTPSGTTTSLLGGGDMPESQKLVVSGHHLQQNKPRQTNDDDDDDTPIDNNTRVQPPAPKRPFEPIPPLLV